MKREFKKAQVTLEFTMIAICVIAGLLLMQHYIKRAAQGRLREAADSIGSQYDPRRIDSNITFTQQGTTIIDSRQVRETAPEAEEGTIDGVRTTATTQDEVVGRRGNETLQRFPEDNDLYDGIRAP